MAEYIEREALLLRIDCYGTNKFGMLDEDIRAFVKAQPAAAVVPVVHTRWAHLGGDEWRCSAFCDMCGREIDYEADGVNLDFNHYGVVNFKTPFSVEKQLCPSCAARVCNFVENYAKMYGGDSDATD